MTRKVTVRLTGALVLAVALAACGGSSTPTSPTPTSSTTAVADVTITITGMNGANSYSPNPGTLRVGQKVAFRNADTITHTATADNGAFDTGNIAPGATSAAITLTTAGTFGYHCRPHPSMVGTLTVS